MKLSRRRLTMTIGYAGFHLPYIVDFTTLVVIPRWFTGLTWSIVSGKAINTPAFIELVTNGGMELDSNWANFNGTPTINARSSEQVHGGTYSRKVQPSTANSGISQALSFPAGSWLRDKQWGYGVLNSDLDYSGGGSINSPGAWGLKVRTILGTANSNTFISFYKNTTDVFYVDDVSVAKLTPLTCFAVLPTKVIDIDISADVTISLQGWDGLGHLGGVFARMDSKTNPQNYIMAYTNGFSFFLDKVVAGTRTNLITNSDANPAYRAGAPLRLLVYGNYVQLKYDNRNVGAYQDISTVGSGTLSGLFSTDTSVQFGSMVVAL